jgi:hypothetical protein
MNSQDARLQAMALSILPAEEEVVSAARDACRRLFGSVPSQSDCVNLIEEEVVRYFRLRGRRPRGVETAEVWKWDQQSQAPVAEDWYNIAGDASRIARLARSLWLLSASREHRRAYLTSWLECHTAQEFSANGDGRLPERKALLGLDAIEDSLQFALESACDEAALQALTLLKESGGRILLSEGMNSPLIAALRSADLRVRFAAADAVNVVHQREHVDPVQLDGLQIRLGDGETVEGATRPASIPGVNRLHEVHDQWTATVGDRLVLICGLGTEKGAEVAARLAEIGYKSRLVPHGRDIITGSRDTADCELVVLGLKLSSPGIRDTLREIRHDYRTSRTPVLIVGEEGSLLEAQRLAAGDSHTLAVALNLDNPSFETNWDHITRELPPPLVPAEDRVAMAAAASTWNIPPQHDVTLGSR